MVQFHILPQEEDDNETRLARWLGPATGYVDGACHWILPINCKLLVRGTIWSVPDDDFNTTERKQELDWFDKEVASKIGDDFSEGTENIRFLMK